MVGVVTPEAASQPSIGLIANPMSGRDVRRFMGRASQQTPEMKRNVVQRAVIGAVAGGARRIVLLRDIFRSVEAAVERLHLHAEIRFLDISLETGPDDTARAAEAMRKQGVGAVIVLGGDGTNRVLTRAWPDAPLVPISTGTNNVFPRQPEPTIAGCAAGLVASGAVALDEVASASKVVRARFEDGRRDLALIDAVLLEGDHSGSLRHFDPEHVRHLVLTRAEPAAVGMSPIGGLLLPTGVDDDRGVEVHCTTRDGGGEPLLVPVSPGVYANAYVARCRELPLSHEIEMRGPGVLAFDGDRQKPLRDGERVRMRVERDGPLVIDEARALTLAAEQGLFRGRGDWHDPGPESGFDCC
jgi:hypothetical protein